MVEPLSGTNLREACAIALREADRNEVEALGVEPWKAPALSLEHSIVGGKFVGRCDGEVAAVFGVAESSTIGVGHPWLLGTDRIARVPVAFVKASRQYVEVLNDFFPILTNVVDERNVTHIRWLSALGFQFVRRYAQYGPRCLPFLQFVRIKPCASLSQPSASA